MARVFEIPLTPEAQKFHVVIAGTDFTMWLNWNTSSALWVLDIGDTDEVPILQGVPLVTGGDLLAGFEYLGIPGPLIAQGSMHPDDPPGYADLGITSHVFWITA
jgi:hypothetical protein